MQPDVVQGRWPNGPAVAPSMATRGELWHVVAMTVMVPMSPYSIWCPAVTGSLKHAPHMLRFGSQCLVWCNSWFPNIAGLVHACSGKMLQCICWFEVRHDVENVDSAKKPFCWCESM